ALDVELSAMQQEGRGEVISNPRIVTSNQREAVISQGQEVGYVTISPQQGGNDIPIPNVQFKDVLLQMKVTPTITNDGRVFLNMAVKKDEVEGFVDTSIGQVPQISKREVNTAVLVEDGQTVVIGGVYEFRDRNDVSKVPFLGDVPFLGNLFKKKGRNKEKAELLIFVTPKVLQVTQR
ncbi:MAG TPA: type IV pilus secretin PilQ, partial [Lysobacter sp.]